MPYNLLQFALRKRDAGGKTMSYDKALIAGKLRRWEKHLMRFRLPEWDEIPDFGLYCIWSRPLICCANIWIICRPN